MTRAEAEALGWVFSPPSPKWCCAWIKHGIGTRDTLDGPTEKAVLSKIARRTEMRKSKPPLAGTGQSTQGYRANVVVRQRGS